MITRHRLLLIIGGFVLFIGLTFWLGRWSPPAYANVTLVSFTATSQLGQPKIFIKWETATEIDTSGFFVSRGDSFAGPFTRKSDLFTAKGSTIDGWHYAFTDTTTLLNQTYYYRLEVVNTNQAIDYHGPISATAGPAINAPAVTPSPTATEDGDPTLPPNSGVVVTPRVVTGETITPQPTSSSSSSTSAAVVATPAPTLEVFNSQVPTPVARSVPSVPNVSMAATDVPPPATKTAQVLAAALVPTDAAPAMVEPVVIATAAASPAASTPSRSSEAVILIAAAILFLGIALLILRQARQ